MIGSVDFAKYVLSVARECNTPLNQTQLQKITYICDGTLLAFGENVIDENPQVWDFGPVYPKIYKWYSKHRSEEVNKNDIKGIAEIIQNENIVKVVLQAVQKFGTWTAGQLSVWSHQAGSPWDKAKAERGMYSKIDKADMTFYFMKVLNGSAS